MSYADHGCTTCVDGYIRADPCSGFGICILDDGSSGGGICGDGGSGDGSGGGDGGSGDGSGGGDGGSGDGSGGGPDDGDVDVNIDEKLTGPQIAGIIIGAIAILGIVGGIIAFII